MNLPLQEHELKWLEQYRIWEKKQDRGKKHKKERSLLRKDGSEKHEVVDKFFGDQMHDKDLLRYLQHVNGMY